MQISCKHFNQLSATEIYAILRLRSEVFVVEQQCIFQDIDNKDQQCYHVCVHDDKSNALLAYARLLPNRLAYEQISIGRVVSSPAARHTGAGRLLMQNAIEKCYELFGKQPIKIGAQLYLQTFYESFGFIRQGDVYDEDGIDHIYMIKP